MFLIIYKRSLNNHHAQSRQSSPVNHSFLFEHTFSQTKFECIASFWCFVFVWCFINNETGIWTLTLTQTQTQTLTDFVSFQVNYPQIEFTRLVFRNSYIFGLQRKLPNKFQTKDSNHSMIPT